MDPSARLRYAPPLVWALLVLVASVAPPPPAGPPGGAPPFDIPLDKLLHALTYAVLSGLLAIAWRARRGRAVALVVVAATGYGLGIELVQSQLPLRAFDPLDALANAIGATVGAATWGALATAVPWLARHTHSDSDVDRPGR